MHQTPYDNEPMASESSAEPTTKDALTPAQGPTPKHVFVGCVNKIWGFVFLHDNVHILSSSDDGTMRKWNCDTGLIVGEPWEGEGGSIYALELSPDGKTIACGRKDGSVQRWDTNGRIEGIWTGHRKAVQSLSWSPSGDHIASGSDDGTILIRKAGSGKAKVGLIDTRQLKVHALAYSPSGDRIASGGYKCTIRIWATKTGKLLIGPIQFKDQEPVTSLVWTSDSSKLCCASDRFARFFDSKSGALLHRFEHDDLVYSISLSPKCNVLACVGKNGIAQLWDTESHEPLSRPFHEDLETLRCASFSRDGRYLAYGGYQGKLTLWTVNDIVPELAVPITQHGGREATQQETRRSSPSSSCLDVDATGGEGIIEEGYDNPYTDNNFFESSQSSLLAVTSGSPDPPNLSSARRFWDIISRRFPPVNEGIPQEHPKRGFFSRRPPSNSSLGPTAINPNQPTSQGNVRAGEDNEEGEPDDDRCPANDAPCAGKDKGKQRDEPPPDLDSKNNRNLWKRLVMNARGKDPTSAPAIKRPKAVMVSAVRGFKVFVARTPGHNSIPLAPPHSSGPSPADPSLQGGYVQSSTSLQDTSGQGGPSSQAIVGGGTQYPQAVGGSSLHFVATHHTSHDSDSDSIEGFCNKFLDKICFPCGRYYEDS